MKIIIDLTNQKFSKLTVLRKDKSIKGKIYWLCKCECGNITSVSTALLRNGNTKSCGCLQKESVKKLNKNKKIINKYNLDYEYGILIPNNSNDEIFFDKEDYDLIKEFCWRVNKYGYVVTSTFNERTNKNNKIIKLHRFIMNCSDGFVVDHINGNKLDNRKCNLRICKQENNTKNHKLYKTNSSGVSGITWNKNNQNWRVRIGNQNIGSFSNFNDAIKARKVAEEKYFGEFSYDNSREK